MRFCLSLAVALLILFSCKQNGKTVILKNELPFDRSEVVSIHLSDLGENKSNGWETTRKDSILANQAVDTDHDSIPDELLIYVKIRANEELQINVSPSNTEEKSTAVTYSRFVPERTDDYAWENDLVAFRTYGPVAQKLVEAGKEGGTLSSGLDCWLKRVNYPIIDKWYKKYTEGGTYHKDDGEGYDPYHVGKSRGCGGIGVWKNDSLYVSKNFISYRKLVDGPVRNIFELTYAPWTADGAIIHETKRITIEAGNQLYKVEDILYADRAIPNITVGITLHDKKGAVSYDSTKGIFSYWEPIDDSALGTAVVADPSTLISFKDFRTDKKDLSHLYVMLKPAEVVSYYTGFAWKKAGRISSPGDWKKYLDQFTERLRSPLKVRVK
jgi:hypothetical protein